MDILGILLDERIDASPRVSFGDGVTLFCQGYLFVKFLLRTTTDKSATLGKRDMIAVAISPSNSSARSA
jgi:hypothetical protein